MGNREIFRCPSEISESLDPMGEACPNWTYVYCTDRCSMDRGPRRAAAFGDPSSVWLACDIQGPAWGANHTPRTWAELYYVNVLYLDGHTRGLLRHTPGTPGLTYDDPEDKEGPHEPPRRRH
jgi:prepilin-type processing-associated H-X9-DG protein